MTVRIIKDGDSLLGPRPPAAERGAAFADLVREARRMGIGMGPDDASVDFDAPAVEAAGDLRAAAAAARNLAAAVAAAAASRPDAARSLSAADRAAAAAAEVHAARAAAAVEWHAGIVPPAPPPGAAVNPADTAAAAARHVKQVQAAAVRAARRADTARAAERAAHAWAADAARPGSDMSPADRAAAMAAPAARAAERRAAEWEADVFAWAAAAALDMPAAAERRARTARERRWAAMARVGDVRQNARAVARSAAAARLPLDLRAAVGMPTAPAVDLLAAARAGAGASLAGMPPAVRGSIMAARPVPEAGASAWAAAAAVFARRARAGAAWLREAAEMRAANAKYVVDEMRRHDRESGGPAAEQSPIVRRLFEGADMAALNAGVAAAAAAACEYADGPAPYERARARWLSVAARLPPDVRATIAAGARLPPRPATAAGMLRIAVVVAPEISGLSAAAGACLPIRAGLSAAAGAAVRAACPAAADACRNYTKSPPVNFGLRFAEVGYMARGPERPELPALSYMAGGVLSGVFAEDVAAAARPAVDVVEFVRPSKQRDDADYEYARATWAEGAAGEKADVTSTQLYEEAMTEGRFAGSMVPGCELPGALFAGRKTCGKIAVLGHIGDRASGHEGKVHAVCGAMSCRGRGCNMCHLAWKRDEARAVADKMSDAAVLGHIKESGASGGARLPVLHVAISFGPGDHAEWLSGPAGRARLRDAAIEELKRRCPWIYAWCVIDHTYRYTDGLEDMYPSPHLHVLMIGWLDYRLNKERFLKYKDVPYEVRPMRHPDGSVTERMYGRGRGVFIKHLSTLDTREDIYHVADYDLSHCTALARRQGELSGGEHAVRWGGALANGKIKTASVSRHERGELVANDLIANSRVELPGVIDHLTVWHATASDDKDGENTVSRAEPRQVFTGSGHEACARGLRKVAARLRSDHPAPAKNGGVVGEVDGSPVETFTVDGKGVQAPPDDYLVLKVEGHSRPEADARAAAAADGVADARRALNADRDLRGSDAAARVAEAGGHALAAAQYVQLANRYDGPDAPPRHMLVGGKAVPYAAEMRRRAGAELRAARGLLAAAATSAHRNLHGDRLARLADRVAAAVRSVAKAAALSKERSRWVVVRVHSDYDHLCTCGARLVHLVFDPGGGEKEYEMPDAMAEAMKIGVEEPPPSDGDGDEESAAAAWLRTDAVGGKDGRAWQWMHGRDWMRERRERYLPAWEVRTVNVPTLGPRRAVGIVYEDGRLTPAPHVDAMHGSIRTCVFYDVLYTHVRADMLAQRSVVRAEGGVSYRLTHEAVVERMLALCTRPPATLRRRP